MHYPAHLLRDAVFVFSRYAYFGTHYSRQLAVSARYSQVQPQRCLGFGAMRNRSRGENTTPLQTKAVNGSLHQWDIAFIAECTTTTHRIGDNGVRVINGSLREGQPIYLDSTGKLSSIQTMSTRELCWFNQRFTGRCRASVAGSLGKGGWWGHPSPPRKGGAIPVGAC